jgi:hypothetical protein
MLSVYAPILYCTFARSEEPLGWIQDRADLISNSFMVVPSKTYRIMGFACTTSNPSQRQNNCAKHQGAAIYTSSHT